MDRTHRCTLRRPLPAIRASMTLGAVPLLLAAAFAPTCYAESTLQTAAPGNGPITASAHLDFRITVLPSLALSTHANGVRIQANGGVLTLQRDARDAWDGRAPMASAQVQPRHRVIDAALPASAPDRGDLVTIASP
jgi:hypothetical protein